MRMESNVDIPSTDTNDSDRIAESQECPARSEMASDGCRSRVVGGGVDCRSFYEALWGVGYVSGDPVAEMRETSTRKKTIPKTEE